MATIQLSNQDARLTYLALQYHLARPGSELDPETKGPAAYGLREVAEALEPQLARAVASIELSERQRERLVSAVAGAMNQLKAMPMMLDDRRGIAPGFDAALRRLFPEALEDPDEAPQLAGHLMALRRRLEALAVEEEPPGEDRSRDGRSWWRFWRR